MRYPIDRRQDDSRVAEVLFDGDGERLLVEVEADLSHDGTVSDALIDIVATALDREEARSQLCDLGARLGWRVRVDGDGEVSVITLTPQDRRPG